MNETHLIITNRTPSNRTGGWIHIVPKGELPNAAANIVQVLDEPALDSILQNIQAEKQRLGDNWPGIYAGREHFIYNEHKDSAALAWFKDFEKRADGIWAKEDGLNESGAKAIANKEYKWTSFVADRRDTAPLTGNKVRILKIDTIGFTNQANGKELLTPITNRNPFRPGDAPAADITKNQSKSMKSIATKLGLSADASEDAVLAEVSKYLNRADITTEALTALRTEHGEFKTQNTALLGEQCDVLLDHCLVKDDKVRNRLKLVLPTLKNREDRLGYLADFGFKPADIKKAAGGQQQRLLNREDGKREETETRTETLTPTALHAEVRKIMNRDSAKFEQAYGTLMSEKPELFAKPESK